MIPHALRNFITRSPQRGRPASRVFVPVVALFALMASPAFAGGPGDKPSAAAADEASRRFRAGVVFYKDGDYAAALVEFKRAYELDPNYKVLFNLGQTSQELNDYASALTAYRKYLQEGGTEIDKARREKVEGFIRTLEKKVGTITIQTNVEGAEVSVDDAPVGKTPLEKPVLVNAGRRKFAASLSGYHPTVRQEEVAGLDVTTVKLDLDKIETAEAPTEAPAKPEPPKPPVKVVVQEHTTPLAPWVSFSVTGAAAIATGVVGGLALSARGDLDTALSAFPGNKSAIDGAQNKVKTLALATDILGGVTAAAAVTTIILFATARRGDAPAKIGVLLVPGALVGRGVF